VSGDSAALTAWSQPPRCPLMADNFGTRALAMGGETVCEAFPRSCVSHCQVGMLYGAWQDIVGTLPAEVAGCAQMASIDLSNNLLSGTIPPEWGQLLEVFDVDLSSNLISGTLPPEWTTQRSMAQLKLNGNRLSGTIPEQLTPVSLQWAQFQRNNISGTLPASWAALASFEQLVAAGNRLSGTLPRGWATTPNGRRFTLLWLDDNSIEGTIPTEWAQTRFEELRLDRNRLSGVLPTELGGHPQALYMHEAFLHTVCGSSQHQLHLATLQDYTTAFRQRWQGSGIVRNRAACTWRAA